MEPLNQFATHINNVLSGELNSTDVELEPDLTLSLSRCDNGVTLSLQWTAWKPISNVYSKAWSKNPNHLIGLQVEVSASLQNRRITWRTKLLTNRVDLIEQSIFSLIKIKGDLEDPRSQHGLSKKEAEEQIGNIRFKILSLANFGGYDPIKPLSKYYEEFKRCFHWTSVDTEALKSIALNVANGQAGEKSIKKFIDLVQAENEVIDLVRSENEKRDLKREWGRIRLINEDATREAWEIVEGHWRFLDDDGVFSKCREDVLRIPKNDIAQSRENNEAAGTNVILKVAITIALNSGGDDRLVMASNELIRNKELSSDKAQQIGSTAITLHQSYCRILQCSNAELISDHKEKVNETMAALSAGNNSFLKIGLSSCANAGSIEEIDLPISIARTVFPSVNGKVFNPLYFITVSPCGQSLIFDDNTGTRGINSTPTPTPTAPTDNDEDSIEAQLERAAMAIFDEEEKRSPLEELSDLGYSLDVPVKSAPPGKDALAIYSELKKTVVGQDDACRAMAAALRCNSTGFGKGSLLLTGKSGTGKSLLISQAAKVMNGIKVVHVSAPALVPEGIRGQTLSDTLLSLVEEGKKADHVVANGIVVFDEFDKIVIGGGFETYYKSTINNILRLIDGCIWNFGTHEEKPKIKTMDTSKLLIVLAGAWQEESTGDSHSVGFSVGEEMKPKRYINTKNLGFPQELLGRISRTIRLNDHTVESLLGILESETVSPWIRAEGILGQEIMVSHGANEKIAKKAVEMGLGARYLDTTVTAVIDRLMFADLKGQVVIDEDEIFQYLE